MQKTYGIFILRISRTARMEEYDRPKTIEAYLDANYPELDDNQREYFISTYKQFADLI